MSTLSTSPRQLTTLQLEARKSVAISLLVIRDTDEEDGVADLTGSVIRFVMANPKHLGAAVLLNLTFADLDMVNGLMRLDIQAAQLDLAEGEYPFGITLTSDEGYSSLIVKGVVAIEENTDPTESVHDLVAPPVGLSVTLMEANRIVVKVDHHPDELLNALYQAAEDAAAAALASEIAAEAAQASTEALVAAAANTYVASVEVRTIKVLTQAAYTALDPKVATTLYVIVG